MRQSNYTKDNYPRTQHMSLLAWTRWEESETESIPDLSPMHISTLMVSPEEALRFAFDDIFAARLETNDGDTFPASFTATFWDMVHNLSESSKKDLVKVFNYVMKNYWTLVFTNPGNKDDFYVAFASPADGKKIVDLSQGITPAGFLPMDMRKADEPAVDFNNLKNDVMAQAQIKEKYMFCSIEADASSDPNVEPEYHYHCQKPEGLYSLCLYGEQEGYVNECKHRLINSESRSDLTVAYCLNEQAQNAFLEKQMQEAVVEE